MNKKDTCLYEPNKKCPIYPCHPFQKLNKEYCLKNCLIPYKSEIEEDLKPDELDEESLKESHSDEISTTPFKRSFPCGRGQKGVFTFEKMRTKPLKKSKGFSFYQRFPLTLRCYKRSKPKIVVCVPKYAKELSQKGIDELIASLLCFKYVQEGKILPKRIYLKNDIRAYIEMLRKKYLNWLKKAKKRPNGPYPNGSKLP